jgi:hypothetical protein
MGFLDFLKKTKVEVEKETVSQDKLQEWLDGRKEKIEDQEQEFFIVAKDQITKFVSDLERKIILIDVVDVDSKKVEERIKVIVKGNVKAYLEYLQKLINNLKEIDNGKEIVDKINEIFSKFENNSRMSYEKSTILVGKEMADARNTVRGFLRDLERIIKKNQAFIDESKILKSLEINITKFNDLKEIKLDSEEEFGVEDKNINTLKERIKENEKKVVILKDSEDFLKENEKRRSLERKKQIVEEKLIELRGLINFKALTNFYHSFEKEMVIVKKYRENFKEAFEKVNGEDLIRLLKEASMQTDKVLEEVEEIQKIKKDLKEIRIEETEAESLEKIVFKLKKEIENFEYELAVKKKRLEKLEDNLKESLGEVIFELGKLDVRID